MPFVATRAGRVFYEQRGSGRPIVMLPATLHDHRDFDPVAARFASRYRTIAVDWPGHGRSDEPDPAQRVSASLLAGVLADLVDDLDLGPAVLVGNSVGGYAASRLALDRPAAVAGLVLVNAGGFSRQTVLSRTACALLGRPAVTRRVLPHLVRAYLRPVNDHDRAVAERVRARARTVEGARTAAALWHSFTTPAFDLRADGPRLTVPTLLTWGTRDVLLPLKAGRQTHAVLPGARFHPFAAGHVVFASDPDGFTALVEPFLDTVFQTSPPDPRPPTASLPQGPAGPRDLS